MEKNHPGFTLNSINACAFGKLKIFNVPKKNRILNFSVNYLITVSIG